jgi:hypothetical protein
VRTVGSPGAFLPVHFQSQFTFKKRYAPFHHSLGGPWTFDIDVAVIGVPYKPVATFFEHAVKLRKVDIA